MVTNTKRTPRLMAPATRRKARSERSASDDLPINVARLTDAHAAELLAERAGGHLRYDQEGQEWRHWDGVSWPVDLVGARQTAVVELAHRIARHALSVPDLELRKRVTAYALRLESRRGTDNCLELAKHKTGIAVKTDVWDRDAWLLNTPTGCIDLHSGRRRPARAGDLCRLVTGARFDPTAKAPRWLQFLNELFPNDPTLVDYLQRWFGYCLTGDVSEQVFVLLLGTGANGKSCLLDVLNCILGGYAYVAPFSTFLRQRNGGGGGASPELVVLAGRRLITASESCEADQLDEARIKSLTGGDSITARDLYRGYDSFAPTGKITLAANHRPQVTDDSQAFWRRCQVVPFQQSFTGDRADRTLIEQLKAEASGILNWLVAGCLAWQQRGLEPPPAVVLANTAYRAANDPLAGFLADCSDKDAGPAEWVLVRDAHAVYRWWARREGLGDRDQLGRRAFGERLGERFDPFHHRTGSAVRGLKLLREVVLEANDHAFVAAR